MDKEIQYLILTRFNLALKFGCSKRADSCVPEDRPWLDINYLEKRFSIFERYTFPSVLNQTEPDFEWIVMFHKETPDVFKEKIQKLSLKMKQFKPLYLDDEQSLNLSDVLKRIIAENYPDKKIITTRIDNDDILHKFFVQKVYSDFKDSATPVILSYDNGLQYNTHKKFLMRYNYTNNHFLSLCALPEEDNNHILAFNHYYIMDIAREKKIKLIVKKTAVPLWIEVITDYNYSNNVIDKITSGIIPYEVQENYPFIVLAGRWKTCLGWLFFCIRQTLDIIKRKIFSG